MEAKDVVLILSTVGTFLNGLVTTILAAYAIRREAAGKEREALFAMFLEHFEFRETVERPGRQLIAKKT